MMNQVKDIDAYIAEYPKDIQVQLKAMRSTIHKAAPKAEEAIRYGLATFRLNGHNLVHFGAFKDHIGFYPTASGVKHFKKELGKYAASKGAVHFALGKRPPLALVTKIVKFRVKEVVMGE